MDTRENEQNLKMQEIKVKKEILVELPLDTVVSKCLLNIHQKSKQFSPMELLLPHGYYSDNVFVQPINSIYRDTHENPADLQTNPMDEVTNCSNSMDRVIESVDIQKSTTEPITTNLDTETASPLARINEHFDIPTMLLMDPVTENSD